MILLSEYYSVLAVRFFKGKNGLLVGLVGVLNTSVKVLQIALSMLKTQQILVVIIGMQRDYNL